MDATAATELLLNVVWTIVGATLVYFMQAGFAMCEAGFTRAKNTGNILMKNMMDFVLGSLFFFIFGFAIMHGTDWNGIIGIKGFFNPTTLADADGLFNGLPIGVFLIFHTVFCATSATIVSGSMAERTKFLAYLLYSAAISIFIYPVTGHWIWGGGWLAQMGFHDFAGSTAVHMVGGICALVGAKILGPRIGKYDKEGNARAIPGHNLSIAALGVFILWFCWFQSCRCCRNTCNPCCNLDPLWKTRCIHDIQRFPRRTRSNHRRMRHRQQLLCNHHRTDRWYPRRILRRILRQSSQDR